MWWKLVSDSMNADITNCSWSGSRVTGAPKGTTAYASCSDIRIQDVGRKGTPDIILCYIGINDWGNEVTLGNWTSGSTVIDDSSYDTTQTISNFCDAYALMISKLKTTYPNSTIYCMTLLDDKRRDETPGAPSDNANGVTVPQFNTKIKDIAQAFNVQVIDLHECDVNYSTAATYLPDGLHPNAAGMQKIANYVLNVLNT